MTGHLLGAAGGIEAIACALVLRHGVVPPTINLEHADPECDLDYVPRQARVLAARVALSTSMGFGATTHASSCGGPEARARPPWSGRRGRCGPVRRAYAGRGAGSAPSEGCKLQDVSCGRFLGKDGRVKKWHPGHGFEAYRRTAGLACAGEVLVTTRIGYLRFLALAIALALLPCSRSEAQYFGQNRVQYRSFDMRVLKTAQFDIYYYPEEEQAARLAARMAERWNARLSRLLDARLPTRQPLICSQPTDFSRPTPLEVRNRGRARVA